MSRHDRRLDLQLAQLRSFCLAATQGTFAEAAEAAGISRAAVWQQVRALERRLGVVLLRRRGRTVELTADGRLVLDLVLPHVQGLESLDRLIEARQAATPPKLTVVAPPGQLAMALHRPLQLFASAYPKARLSLLTELRARQVERVVERGAADVGVLVHAPDEPRSASLEYQSLFEAPLLLLTAADHPLARKRRLAPTDLAGHPLILAPLGSIVRRSQDRFLRQHGLAEPAHVVMESEHTHIVAQYVALGLGITLWNLQRWAVGIFPGLHGRVFDPAFEVLGGALVVPRYAKLAEHVEEFCRIVRQFVASQQS
ncbi:MAG: LysR family transcriptional regulator [Planctomycetia bacterium]|nr:LysR family transcriptional regulator [Planctomycetia bacterium]